MILRRPPPSALAPLLAAAAIAASGPVQAQSFPSRAVKVVVPTSPGGATDAFARALAARLSIAWGQAVVLENRAGADPIPGAPFVSKAPPPRHTLPGSDPS